VFAPLTLPAVVARIGTHVLTLGFALLAVGFTVAGWAARRQVACTEQLRVYRAETRRVRKIFFTHPTDPR
jgi:hypothetical protein